MDQSVSLPVRATRLLGFNNQRDVRALLKHGKRIERELFRCVVRRTANSASRFGFVIPRSIEKRSTKRNRIRRMAREWFRARQTQFQPPVDLLIIFKKSVLGAPKKIIYEEFTYSLRHMV